MEKEKILQLKEAVEAIKSEVEGVECWFARDLQNVLGYSKWENFSKVIDKAKTACENSGERIADQFPDVRKLIEHGKGGQREVDDILLTRYACYLIAQNGDPRKEEIAFAQSYFAVQTRKLEVIEERIRLNDRLRARKKLTAAEKELSELIYQRGVDQQGFGRIRSRGDQVLFGGNSTQTMKIRLGVPENRPLADFLPEISINAKNLANSITNFNVRQKELYGEEAITEQHVSSNHTVREALLKEGIVPENLPADEDIKKLERRVKAEEKKMVKKGGKSDK